MFPIKIDQGGVKVVYTPRFTPPELAARLFDSVLAEVAWEQPRVRIFGREHPVPRWVAWHADAGCTYRYSGLEHPWRPWTPALQQIRTLVERVHGPQHAVLANLYEDGSHGIGAHADDENDLTPEAPILIVSLGATRNFVIKHRTSRARYVLSVEHGSLLEMAAQTNTVAVHSVPKTQKPVGPRISLTFRQMAVATHASCSKRH